MDENYRPAGVAPGLARAGPDHSKLTGNRPQRQVFAHLSRRNAALPGD